MEMSLITEPDLIQPARWTLKRRIETFTHLHALHFVTVLQYMVSGDLVRKALHIFTHDPINSWWRRVQFLGTFPMRFFRAVRHWFLLLFPLFRRYCGPSNTSPFNNVAQGFSFSKCCTIARIFCQWVSNSGFSIWCRERCWTYAKLVRRTWSNTIIGRIQDFGPGCTFWSESAIHYV